MVESAVDAEACLPASKTAHCLRCAHLRAHVPVLRLQNGRIEQKTLLREEIRGLWREQLRHLPQSVTANTSLKSCEAWAKWRKMAWNYAEMWPERKERNKETDRVEGTEEDYQLRLVSVANETNSKMSGLHKIFNNYLFLSHVKRICGWIFRLFRATNSVIRGPGFNMWMQRQNEHSSSSLVSIF